MTNLQAIKNAIFNASLASNRDPNEIELLAVTKNHTLEDIQPLLDEGQRLFGENRVQEAFGKWPKFKNKYSNIELHLIGHLQTNKVRDAVTLFDAIQTLDSIRLADKLALEQERQKKNLNYLIEINIGREKQKTGVWPEDFPEFLSKLQTYPLNIQGIMCIPPRCDNPLFFFQRMKKIMDDFQLKTLSIGMSDDFQDAIQCGSTMVRIGTALFAKVD